MNTDLTEGNEGNKDEKAGSWERGIADLRFEISKLKNMHSLQNFYAQ
jgi:hypothetical protein